MIDVKTVVVEGTLEDTALVRLPRAGGNTDGDGARLGDGVEEGEVVVGGELNVVLDVGDSSGDAIGVGAISRLEEVLVGVDGAVSILSVVGGVSHLVLLDDAAVLHGVVEGEVDGGSSAASGSAALLRVGHATDELLGGKVEEGPGLDGDVRLEDSRGGEGPAGAAASLVLDSSDDTLLTPVNRGGEGRRRLNLEGELVVGEGADVGPGAGGSLGVSEVALFLGKVGEVVHSLVVSAAEELVVLHDVLQVGLEEGLAAGVFFRVIVLGEILHVGGEVVRLVKLVVLGGLGRGRGGEEEGGEGEEFHL
mmetsp:Transcript_15369/g.28714  ORF Transcript_15369/g.28714 Transcript_15369/m.28714 type:complete len:307 (-) Transcript_15369:32-952(-)